MLFYIFILIIFIFLFSKFFNVYEHLNYNNLSISSIHQLTSDQIYNIPKSPNLYNYIIPKLTNNQLILLPNKTLKIIAGYLTNDQINILRNTHSLLHI
jgi:hypothetical protein